MNILIIDAFLTVIATLLLWVIFKVVDIQSGNKYNSANHTVLTIGILTAFAVIMLIGFSHYNTYTVEGRARYQETIEEAEEDTEEKAEENTEEKIEEKTEKKVVTTKVTVVSRDGKEVYNYTGSGKVYEKEKYIIVDRGNGLVEYYYLCDGDKLTVHKYMEKEEVDKE